MILGYWILDMRLDLEYRFDLWPTLSQQNSGAELRIDVPLCRNAAIFTMPYQNA